jgi:hypothetical protein
LNPALSDTQISPQHDGRFFWKLAPGEWNVRTVSRVGTAEETITVEETQDRPEWTVPNVFLSETLRAGCRG